MELTPPTMSENEDYDDVKFDGGGLIPPDASNSSSSLSGGSSPGELAYEEVRAPADADRASPHGRRKSVQVNLERTATKGHYVLTAADPEIRRILRHGLEREQRPQPRVRFRDLVFTRQFSTFDRQNSLSYDSPFRGWFTLFWLCIALLLIRVAAKNWRTYGSVLGRNEIWNLMFERDVVVLGLTDGVMCAATLFGFVLQKAIVAGYLTWEGPGYIIEHLWQASYLGAVLYWTIYRDWPWTHTIFTVLHCMVFLMKQHSYSFYNGYLSQVYRRKQLLEEKLRELSEKEPTVSRPNSPMATSFEIPQSDGLRQRRRSSGSKASTNVLHEESVLSTIARAVESGEPLDADQLEALSRVVRNEIEGLSSELRGKSTSEERAYPNNLTFANFVDWTMLPTLVYELEYPRQERINWWYVAEKTAATFGIIWVMIVVSQAYIYPPVAETVRMKEAGMTLQERAQEFPWIVSDILFPLLLEQILTWYLIWECILNVLAELTRFADRGFYGDWWNSVSFDQYARDWNRPVHNFLLRHVYHSTISSWHLSKGSATFVTFLLSALVHELVMFCLFKKVRGYLFAMQLLQIPLVSLSRTRLLKGRNVLGNVVFWIGLFVGPSVLTSLYLIV
ncbi:Membrane bound O-acyl transferase [Lasiodiplodia theobromae]|uniref:Sterol O-acyltransferase 2 n=2 Tax=Lasiodiplodia TaxID=66739 RepID=A0A5N5DCP4_9PEZI|nr:Membrane bound O-acyl transferase [Lasiodiplodia theobromae]KAB2575578.1 Sterol O-acyltransferase 2 [Lasiodiplodia theobromae]KAF4536371.1 Membrane bound O-acyl transferase [Lasiodiplodia theobromae]